MASSGPRTAASAARRHASERTDSSTCVTTPPAIGTAGAVVTVVSVRWCQTDRHQYPPIPPANRATTTPSANASTNPTTLDSLLSIADGRRDRPGRDPHRGLRGQVVAITLDLTTRPPRRRLPPTA